MPVSLPGPQASPTRQPGTFKALSQAGAQGSSLPRLHQGQAQAGRHFVSVTLSKTNPKETFLLPAVGVVFPTAALACKLSVLGRKGYRQPREEGLTSSVV